jgi:hypothetical protein
VEMTTDCIAARRTKMRLSSCYAETADGSSPPSPPASRVATQAARVAVRRLPRRSLAARITLRECTTAAWA